MRFFIAILAFAFIVPAFADGEITFNIGERTYALTGAQATLVKRNGKTQFILGVRDLSQRTQFTLTAELDAPLTAPIEISTKTTSLSAVIVSMQGFYTVVPSVTFSKDDFMRYTYKEEYETGEMEDDPTDDGTGHIRECRQNRHAHACKELLHSKRRKRPKKRVRYVKRPPTWVGKTHKERLESGDGIAREQSYDNTVFLVRLTPQIAQGKVVSVSGTFGGVLLHGQGLKQQSPVPLNTGTFSVPVKELP